MGESMGLFDFLKKPSPQMISVKLNDAIANSRNYSQKGDKENALKALLEYKDLGWDNANYVMQIALAYYYAGQCSEAIDCNRRAIELNPENGRAYINLGRAYFEVHDYENAASSYARAISLIEEKPQGNQKEDHPIACAWYGASIAMTGKKEEGEAFIKKAEAEGYQKGDGLRQAVGLRVSNPRTGSIENASAKKSKTPDALQSRKLCMLISKYGNGSEELIREFERKHGVELDGEYRRFLLMYNGGDTPETQVRSRSFSSNLRFLYGIRAEKNLEDHMQIPEWPDKSYLPIGEDSFGNFYAILVAGENRGSIFFCDHENEFHLKQIADSFSQFVKKCKSEGIAPRSRMTPEEREARMIAEGKAGNITDGLREIWKQEYEKYKDMIQEEVIL